MTWQGSGANARKNEDHAEANRVKATLRVIAAETLPKEEFKEGPFCFLPRNSPLLVNSNQKEPVFVYARTYPQFLVRVIVTSSVKDLDNEMSKNWIALSEISRKNLEVCTEADFLFAVHGKSGKENPLSDVSIDIRPKFASEGNGTIFVDADVVAKKLKEEILLRHIATRHEYIALSLSDDEFKINSDETKKSELCIICEIVFLCYPEDLSASLESVTLNTDDAYRGCVCEETKFHVRRHATARTARKNFTVLNEKPHLKRRVPRDMVHILTDEPDDGEGNPYNEEIPVKKELLRSCLYFAPQVCEGKGKYKRREEGKEATKVASVHVPLDCCIVDRVLMYLQQEYQNRKRGGGKSSFTEEVVARPVPAADAVEENFRVSLAEAPELLKAAQMLECRGLEDICKKVLGSFSERVRKEGIHFAEVEKWNSEGKCVVILDGMTFDITDWLPKHPGGKTIIPKQALGFDAARLFEVYHAGRDPLLYLKEFYIGDIIEKVPYKKGKPPSEDFIKYLREETAEWRVVPQVQTFKSF